ncbi:Protein indeterminate-domain like [Actinidia chinensis var. chinensis]|uniref:Protein indeterminate-domain like n=1 Tax=Actinidia chinensis var. chinensis TaxID=1590841 RepID=A0A2R6R3G9_ACTCC|nr:Protein indeterminate-domain like [Actinidia chinensis var. chinensis]
MVEFENSSSMAVSAEGSVSSSGELLTIPPVTAEKKRRNLPGMPDPDAEVIAMSPKSLLATNRFVCEICSKGFQRDQNLQLHRRGHNLPWKLRQRAGNEVRKRVYVCPELTCVHHDPKRALGDLTGIKKHFCRKHGEKKWKCERCAKKYAVLSDWKAHLKTCGTREYRCDCGTLFSRRDSFITHRAFCDALAQESSRAQTLAVADSEGTMTVQTVASSSSSPPQPPLTPSTGVLSPVLSIQSSEAPENLPAQLVHQQPVAASSTTPAATITTGSSSTTGGNGLNSGDGGVFASIFASSAPPGFSQPSQSPSSFSDMLCAMASPDPYSSEPMLLSLSSSLYLSTNPSSLFPNTDQDHHHPCPPQPALSATALLQKAAQMGATGSGSFLRGLGLELPSSSNNLVKSENISIESGLGLGLPTAGPSHLLGPSSLYGNEPTTLDLLGLGMGGGGASTAGFSALLTSIGGGLDVATATAFRVNSNGDSWEGPSERKPSLL